ncbi:bifunctional riboflavin kinase/FAD synthetase [Rhizobium vallis]|uniref:Riboflavin biosynthesis protein n=1 Tax=Rhizobium vallis TaxID=634290 RepID=A0A3S0QLH7_9HYPH|nr:bifunctional riboflavin kinase/FAD synthetase [Rhizobium vallis]RUM20499.1 bifunctional riboflavin kinase/FAD synthetase [Rhizobium vallis]
MTNREIVAERRVSSLNRLTGNVIALGNFDGVHRGHQALLQAAHDLAIDMRLQYYVACFSPHPKHILQPSEGFFELSSLPQKEEHFQQLGAAGTLALPFDAAVSRMSPREFCDWLWETTKPRAITVGCDFHFGNRRAGGPAYLRDYGQRAGTLVKLIDPSRDREGEAFTSEQARTALSLGDIDRASDLLGYRYRVEAKVIHGAKLGRTLGFPTANMELARGSKLCAGIYAVKFKDGAGREHDGVASFGRRPTVTADGLSLLETYVFSYSGDLYGQTCTVTFVKYLRPELKFDGLPALVAQMKRDEADARVALAKASLNVSGEHCVAHPLGASGAGISYLSSGETR